MSGKQKLALAIGTLALVILVLGFAYIRQVPGQDPDPYPNPMQAHVQVSVPYPNPQQVPAQAPDDYREAIQLFMNELQNPALSLEERKNIEIKLRAYTMEATKAADRTFPTPDKLLTPWPTQPAPPRIPDGIVDGPDIILNGQVILNPQGDFASEPVVSSVWRKTTPERYYLVASGHLASDAQQGMVLVLQPTIARFHMLLTPRKSGDVRIVEDRFPYLVLQAQNGDVFYFDPAGERFIDSLDVPTYTPTPTQTPTQNPYP